MEQIIEFLGNHVILSGIWMALAIMLLFSLINGAFSPVKALSTHDATLLMNKDDAFVLDIRQANEFKSGHILGAKQLKAEQINKADFASLEKNKDKPIIVVCAMGMTAKKTAMQLIKAGFPQVSILKGGMNAWTTAGLPVSK